MMGLQTWGWGSRHGDGVPDMGMGFWTWGWGSRHGGGVPDKGWGNNIYESPKWNYSLLDFINFSLFGQRRSILFDVLFF